MKAMLEKTEMRESITMENNGQRIFGILHRPLQETPSPIVVFCHGFASSKHGTQRAFVYLAEALARENIASLRFDFRGAGDSEGNLSELSFNDLVADAVTALNYLPNLEKIDMERVGLFGSSLGGAIAVFSAANNPDRGIKALALWAPVASGELWYRDVIRQNPEFANANVSKAFSSFRGETINPHFREQFGQMHAARMMGDLYDLPILHMHGENDTTLSLNHQSEFRKYANPKCRFISYPQTEHAFGCAQVFSEVVTECVGWFKKNL
ncbi:MAG: alpha/beta fold hydrolase [Chlamydiales bacterium]